MKRYFIAAIACLLMAASAGAQDSYFAELLSRNNYYGTARSIGMGNAVTAVGGDLGTVGINPAGSAVNPYGQFTVTPALLFQNTGTNWSATGSENSFESPFRTSHTKFNLPNCGGTAVLYSGSDYGIKYVTMGFIANTTNSFLNYTTAGGANSATSFLGNMADAAYGMGPSSMPNDIYTAYCANQFGAYGYGDTYMGSNQRWVVPVEGGVEQWDKAWTYVPGTLDQKAVYNTYGSKTDLLFNFGFNVSDSFYFGFNLGLPVLTYRREEVFSESARGPELFPNEFYAADGTPSGVSNYLSSANGFKMNASASGIYAKAGFIWLPNNSLRIGAAIQSPTALDIEEQWQYSANCSFEDGRYSGSASSEIGQNSYMLRTPYVVDLGVAYTFGGAGLLSVDYELTDYSVMKYRNQDENYFFGSAWEFTNKVNRNFCGISHALRLGAEFKPAPEFTLRAGYGLVTDPEKYCKDSYGNIVTAQTYYDDAQLYTDFKYFSKTTNSFSLGAGYASNGSFFCDAAVRLTKYPTLYYNPYYYGDYTVLDQDCNVMDVGMPLVQLKRKVLDVVLTFGWRF